MLSISFTTEHSCVSSLTFMVLGSPPSCETQVTGKIPEPHDGGGEGGYFSDTLEYFKAQFVLNFWNTFGGRTSTQYIKVSSEGATKHSEKYKQEHLAIFFHAQQESSVSKWKCSMSMMEIWALCICHFPSPLPELCISFNPMYLGGLQTLHRY